MEKRLEISLEKSAALPPEGVFWVNLPPDSLNVLTQMRTKMSTEGLEDLAASIKQSGQINQGIVIGLSTKEAKKYLARINQMWGTKYRLESFRAVHLAEMESVGDTFYLFLAAGHRRLKAVIANGSEKFYCQLRVETTFSEALYLQFQENLHEAVPQDDEARFLTFLWQQEKTKKPALTLSRFARNLGKKPEAVRRSIRFTSLPVLIQKLVLPSKDFKKGICFGILCELARLQEARIGKEKAYTQRELLHLAYVLVVQQKTAKACSQWVSQQISELNGQGNMFELSLQEAIDHSRDTVGSKVEALARNGTAQLRVVARLHTDGGVEKVVSSSAAAAVTRTIETVHNLAPQIVEGVRGTRHAPAARKAVQEVVEA